MSTIKKEVTRNDTPRPSKPGAGGNRGKAEKGKSGSPVKSALVSLSIVVVFIGVFLAFDGEKAIRSALKYYFKSNEKDSSSTLSSDDNVQEKEQKEVFKLDWRSSPLNEYPFFTDTDIKYVEGSKPYLVILGHVFDVTSGFKSYQPGSGYHGFIGQDGTRAFITGKFDADGLVSDLTGLGASDFQGLADWLEFYIKTYQFVGYHYGTFFGEDKKAKTAYKEFLEMLDVAAELKKAQESVQKEFPSCNVEWSDKDGTNVWCSTKSGGIDRDWIGFPILFKESPDKDARCACVRESQFKDPRLEFYPGCDHKKRRCNGIGK